MVFSGVGMLKILSEAARGDTEKRCSSFLGAVQALNQNPFSALRLSLSYPFRMLDMKRDLSKLQHTEYVRYYWYARPDSNGGPTDSKSGALSN